MSRDDIIEFGDQRVLIPGGVKNLPKGAQALVGIERNAVVLAFVTTDPTPEAIVSGGSVAVATFGMVLTHGDFRQFVNDLNGRLPELSPP